MRPVAVRELFANAARLGITQTAGRNGDDTPVERILVHPVEPNAWIPERMPSSAVLLVPAARPRGGFGGPRHVRLFRNTFRGVACVAVAQTEIPPDLQAYSERTGMPVFASCYDDSLLHSRLTGLFGEIGERRVMVHGVLVQVAGRGILLMGESGVGKTAVGLLLAHSDNRWVADDAVVLEARGDDLYGGGHERTRNWIAVRGRGILRADALLGAGRLLAETRVDLLVRLLAPPGGGQRVGCSSFREFAGVSLPCEALATEGDPGHTASQVRNLVRDRLGA